METLNIIMQFLIPDDPFLRALYFLIGLVAAYNILDSSHFSWMNEKGRMNSRLLTRFISAVTASTVYSFFMFFWPVAWPFWYFHEWVWNKMKD